MYDPEQAKWPIALEYNKYTTFMKDAFVAGVSSTCLGGIMMYFAETLPRYIGLQQLDEVKASGRIDGAGFALSSVGVFLFGAAYHSWRKRCSLEAKFETHRRNAAKAMEDLEARLAKEREVEKN